MIEGLLTRLLEAGTPMALVAEVAAELARAEAVAAAQIAAAAAPTKGALRTRAYRERLAASPTSQKVTCDAGDDVVTESVTAVAPSPPPLLAPQTPQTTPPPHPHPDNTPHVREAARSASAKRRWPRTAPPPSGVSEDQWAGFVAHRLAKRSPLTDRAYDLLVGKLAKSSSDEWPPGRIIDTIVERGWVSFEMEWLTKGTGASNGKLSHHDRPSAWRSGDLPAGAAAASLDD